MLKVSEIDEVIESETTYKRLFTPSASKRALVSKTLGKDKPVFRYSLIIMKTPEHKK